MNETLAEAKITPLEMRFKLLGDKSRIHALSNYHLFASIVQLANVRSNYTWILNEQEAIILTCYKETEACSDKAIIYSYPLESPSSMLRSHFYKADRLAHL
jgi:hypothetical protein